MSPEMTATTVKAMIIGLTQLEVPGLVGFIAVQTRNGFDTLRYSTRRNCATTNLLRKS